MQPIPQSFLEKIVTAYYTEDPKERIEGRLINPPSKQLVNNILKTTDYNTKEIRDVILSLKTNETANIIKILSGHNNLNYHLHNTGLSYTQLCEYCTPPNTDEHDINSELETASHLICECPAFTKTRLEIFHQPFIKEEKLFQGKRLEATIRKILKSEEKKNQISKKKTKNEKTRPFPEKKNRKRKITIDKTNSKKTQNKIKKHREIWE